MGCPTWISCGAGKCDPGLLPRRNWSPTGKSPTRRDTCSLREEDMAGSGTRRAAFAAALALGVGMVGAVPATATAPAAARATARPTAAAPAAVQAQTSAHSDRQIAKVDRAFLVVAHDSNLNEILAGQLALARATDERVRALAQMFIEHHTLLD